MRYNNKNIAPKLVTKALNEFIDIISSICERDLFDRQFMESRITYSEHREKGVDYVIQRLVESSIVEEIEGSYFRINSDIKPFLNKLFDIYTKASREDFEAVLLKIKSVSGDLEAFSCSDVYSYPDLNDIILKVSDVMTEAKSLASGDAVVLNNKIDSIKRMEYYHERVRSVKKIWNDFLTPSEFLFKSDGEKPFFLKCIEDIKFSLSKLKEKRHMFSSSGNVSDVLFIEKIDISCESMDYIYDDMFSIINNQRHKINEINSVYTKDPKFKNGISVFMQSLTDPDKCSEGIMSFINSICSDREIKLKKIANNTYAEDIDFVSRQFFEIDKKKKVSVVGAINDIEKVNKARPLSENDLYNDLSKHFSDNNIEQVEDIHSFVVDMYLDLYNDRTLRGMIGSICFSRMFIRTVKPDLKRRSIDLHDHTLDYYPFSVRLNKKGVT